MAGRPKKIVQDNPVFYPALEREGKKIESLDELKIYLLQRIEYVIAKHKETNGLSYSQEYVGNLAAYKHILNLIT